MTKLSLILLLGCAAAPGLASAAGLETLAVALRPTAPAPEAVGGGGDVVLKAESLESKLEFDFTTGQPADRSRWSAGRLALRQAWTPAANLDLVLDARSQSRSERDQGSERRAGEADAHIASRFSPFSTVDLQLGAGAHRTETSAVAARDRLERAASDVSASLAWRLKRLTLEGGGRMETVNLGWRKADAVDGRGGYVMSEPRLDGRLALWDGAALRFGATRAAAQLNPDEVASLADAADYRPDREWRYETGVDQALGAAQFRVGLSLARREAMGAEPVSSERRQVETALSAPLQLGLGGPLKVSARAAWQRSALAAPATGGIASQLGAYDAEVALDQSLHGLAWGVSARASGPVQSYRMGERIDQAGGASVSGFLAYRPGPVAIRLDAHALAEGERTRQSWGGLPLVERQRGVERRLQLTLVKAL